MSFKLTPVIPASPLVPDSPVASFYRPFRLLIPPSASAFELFFSFFYFFDLLQRTFFCFINCLRGLLFRSIDFSNLQLPAPFDNWKEEVIIEIPLRSLKFVYAMREGTPCVMVAIRPPAVVCFHTHDTHLRKL